MKKHAISLLSAFLLVTSAALATDAKNAKADCSSCDGSCAGCCEKGASAKATKQTPSDNSKKDTQLPKIAKADSKV